MIASRQKNMAGLHKLGIFAISLSPYDFTIFTGFFPYFLKERKNHALIVPAALWSSGLRRNPLKVESRVRFPAGSPNTHNDIRKDVFCLYVLMVFLREVFFIHEKKDLFILR